MNYKYKFISSISLLMCLFVFSTNYSPVNAQTLNGDANGDGVVDGKDYTRWLNNYNKATSAGASEGDFNNDGMIDGRDYVVWVNNYGRTGQVAFQRTSPWPVLSRVEMENYDMGGQDVSYSDTTPTNDGNSTYRNDSVDLREYSGATVIGNIMAGEWVEYTMNSSTAGNYLLTVSSGSIYSGRSITFSWNGNVVGQISVPVVSAWGQHQTSSTVISLPSGSGVLKANFDVDYISADWFEMTESTTTPAPTTTPTGDKLSWAKPALTNPTTINLSTSSNLPTLDTTKDYIINLPTNAAYPKVLYITGGRNIHLIGGVISVNSDTSSTENAAIRVYDATGTVHIEGVKLTGAYITDGVHTRAPQATVQLQNVFVDKMWQKGGDPSTGSHGDCIQTWGGVKELRVDKFTCISSPYQGMQLHADYNPPMYKMTFRRTDVHGDSNSRYLFWVTPSSWATGSTLTLDNVWMDNPNRSLYNTVCMYYNSKCTNGIVEGTDSIGQYVSWPNEAKPVVTGKIYEGTPPGGVFVPASSVGFGYQSPGYN